MRAQEFMGRAVVQAAVRSFMVVFGPPGGNTAPCLPEIFEPAGVQTFIAELAVEAFDKGVLNRLPRLDVMEFNSPIDSPGKEVPAGQFGPVVQADALRSSPIRDHCVERSCYPAARQTSIHIERETFACEGVNDGQDTQGSPVRQPIVDEIE